MPNVQTAVEDGLSPPDAAARKSRWSRLGGAVRRQHVLESAVLLALPIVTLAALGWNRRWMSDDGFINVRVIQNLFAGHGPVYNVGERVEVGTSTLWLVAISVGHALAPFVAISRVAVYGGLLATVLGLVTVSVASVLLWRHLGRQGMFVPLGTVVIAALPPFWDFATSGLETGLTFLWLGSSFLLLVVRLTRSRAAGAAPPPAWRPVWPAVVVGLGPLVRPDLTLIAVVLGVALLAQSRRSVGSWVGAAAAALALPVLYELFRAGYYGTLVPNTALAKGAGESQWANGLHYLADFAGLYGLALPLVLIALAILTPGLAETLRRRDLGVSALLAAPVLGAVLHSLFVLRVGGDFMHGRFLLPATFCVLMPVAAVAIGHDARVRLPVLATALAVIPWAVFVAADVRPGYEGIGPRGIADERSFYTAYAMEDNPIYIGDYADDGAFLDWYQQATSARAAAEQGARVLIDGPTRYPAADGYGVVGRMGNIGIYGVAAGPEVFVADRLSLASAIGSRLEVELGPESRIGHSQEVPLAWDLARYAQPAPGDPREVQDARAALQCAELAELDRAIAAPMTVDRFLDNLRAAPVLTRLTIPIDPADARAAFCGGS